MNLYPESRRAATIDAQILTALRSAGDSVSGAELAQQLRISRAAVWARIEELRSLGYDIEASPHNGYRLLNAPDVLHADDLLSRLGKTRIVGRDIRVFQETTSTNDIIEKLAHDGVKEGVVVFAESQTKGAQRALVFGAAPSKTPPASGHATDHRRRNGSRSRDSFRNRRDPRDQMAK